MVATHDLQVNVRLALRCHEGEGSAVSAVKLHVDRPHIGAGITRGGEADDLTRRQRCHGLDVRIVSVENDGASRTHPLDEFCLRGGNTFKTTEAAHVGVSDAQLDGNVRGDDIGQIGDVTGSRCAHLEDEVARRFIGQKHRQRQANLVVE